MNSAYRELQTEQPVIKKVKIKITAKDSGAVFCGIFMFIVYSLLFRLIIAEGNYGYAMICVPFVVIFAILATINLKIKREYVDKKRSFPGIFPFTR